MLHRSIYIVNNLNESVSVDVFLGDFSEGGPTGQNIATSQTVAANSTAFIGGGTSIGAAGASGQETGLVGDYTPGVGVGITAATAPTSGTITIYHLGLL